MFKKSTIAALAVVVSATGFTASASQLTERLGVEEGVYTTAELIRLNKAREDNDKATENFLLSKPSITSRGGTFATSSNETVIKAYFATKNFDDENANQADNFVRRVNGEFHVSDETIAFAKEHLSDVNED